MQVPRNCLQSVFFVGIVWFSQALQVKSTVANVDVRPGASLTVEGSSLLGNDIVARDNPIPSGARRIWMDPDVVLPAGDLEKYFVYILPMRTNQTEASLRLQIWRPLTDDVTSSAVLVFEEIVSVLLNYTSGALYEFTFAAPYFETQPGDRIGWTNPNTFSVISIGFNDTRGTTLNQPLPSNISYFPQVNGDAVYFNTTAFPVTYSVAVLINEHQRRRAVFGNDITARDTPIASGARRIWIEPSILLPAGDLEKYFIYVLPNRTVVPTDQTEASLRLQIWRPLPDTDRTYLLVFEEIVAVSLIENGGKKYEFSFDEPYFKTESMDRIGWTNPNTFSVISASFNDVRRTLNLELQGDNFPVVDETEKDFNTIEFPISFSIAVQINTGEATTTANPTSETTTTATTTTSTTTTSTTTDGSTTTVSACVQLEPCGIEYNGEVLGGDCNCNYTYQCNPDGSDPPYDVVVGRDCIEDVILDEYCLEFEALGEFDCCRECARWAVCRNAGSIFVLFNGQLHGAFQSPCRCNPSWMSGGAPDPSELPFTCT